ncbi:MAG TPA: hypothetical protein VF658_08025 [Pyrinomonadaceae bacterium]|jgi:hypothetical protein
MQKLLVFCALLLLSATIAFAHGSEQVTAQKRLDFNGTWIPSVEKERKPDAGPRGWTNMIIEQHGPELKFTLVHPNPDGKTTRRLNFTFYTDGRGETNTGTVYYMVITNQKPSNEEVVKSTTKWDGEALVVVHRMVDHQGAVTVNSDLTMRWELSRDGKTLARTMKTTNYSATYKETESGEERALKVTVDGAADKEFKDTYIRLEAKR